MGRTEGWGSGGREDKDREARVTGLRDGEDRGMGTGEGRTRIGKPEEQD